jgi:ubiquinone/menaquinone biosynthesis C-methylase UbiE
LQVKNNFKKILVMTPAQWNEYQRQADAIEQNEKRKSEKQKTVMTPKEKANELFDLMTGIGDDHHHCSQYVAKQCALIAVDLAIEAATSFLSQEVAFEKSKEYWYNVKIEIVKMFGISE